MRGLFHRLSAYIFLLLCTFLVPTVSKAQSCRNAGQTGLYELRMAVRQPAALPGRINWHSFSASMPILPTEKDKKLPSKGIFLPRWSASDLPFFCKIEHDWAKNHARIPLKFRLGSVEYVDWLEGKTDMPGY